MDLREENGFGEDLVNSKDLFLKGIFDSGVSDMQPITIDSDNAGTYTSIVDDGGSGSITIDVNGGGFNTFSSPLVLSVSDVLTVKRTITTASGYFKLIGTYV